MPGSEARGEQAEGRYLKTAVRAEKLVVASGSLLEGASGLDFRDEINHGTMDFG